MISLAINLIILFLKNVFWIIYIFHEKCIIDMKENHMDNTNLPSINIDPSNPKLSPAQQYSVELQEDLKLNLANLREKSLTTSSMKAKWIGYLAKEKEAIIKLNNLRSEHQKKIMAASRGVNAFDKLKNANTEDDTIKKIDTIKKQVEASIEIINHAITALTEFGYNIKNAIEVIKLNG